DAFVALGQPRNEFVGMSSACRPDNLVSRGIRSTISDVLGNGCRKEHGFLQYNRKLAAQVGNLIVTQIDPIKQYVTCCRIVKTREEAHERRFSCSRRSNYGYPSSCIDVK